MTESSESDRSICVRLERAVQIAPEIHKHFIQADHGFHARKQFPAFLDETHLAQMGQHAGNLFQQFYNMVDSIVVGNFVVNSFGDTVMAAFTITNRIEQIVQQPYSSLGAAITTYAGQNMGAARTDRVKKGFAQSVLILFGVLGDLAYHRGHLDHHGRRVRAAVRAGKVAAQGHCGPQADRVSPAGRAVFCGRKTI